MTVAALAAGSIGVFQVGGRPLVTALRGRLPQHRVTALIFLGQGGALVVLLCTNGTGSVASGLLVVFAVLFGLGFGLQALPRGTLVPEYYGPRTIPASTASWAQS